MGRRGERERAKKGQGSVDRFRGGYRGRLVVVDGRGSRRRKVVYGPTEEIVRLKLATLRERFGPYLGVPKCTKSERAMGLGFVYFVQAGDGGPIKIGFTKDLEGRLGGIQVGCPTQLVPLGIRKGTRADERAVHVLFRAYRRSGEWFEPHDEILRFINGFCETFTATAAA